MMHLDRVLRALPLVHWEVSLEDETGAVAEGDDVGELLELESGARGMILIFQEDDEVLEVRFAKSETCTWEMTKARLESWNIQGDGDGVTSDLLVRDLMGVERIVFGRRTIVIRKLQNWLSSV